MAENRHIGLSDAGRYEIRIGGRIGPRWAPWFDGMGLTTADDGTTVLSGPVADQAALHGVLQQVRDLGLPLLSLTRIHAEHPHGSTTTPRRP